MTPRAAPRGILIVAFVTAFACSPVRELGDVCTVVQPSTALPGGLEETSGVAASVAHDGVLWTHNDSGGDPEVVAVRVNGELVARVPVQGARARDWEDLALGPCPDGACLYIGDIGDGSARRAEIGVYRLAEPDPMREESVSTHYFPARYPGGARDAEALFVLPNGELYLVTKGREESVELYRYPQPLTADEPATLELVRTLAPGPQTLEAQVTGASASPSGEWVAVRRYKNLQLWRTSELLRDGGAPFLTVDLSPIGEVQGEAVALLDNGGVVLTSEGGFPGAVGSVALAVCELPPP
jgi:hypothetical protein